MPLTHLRTIPILRSFDETKAREFYVDWLGFAVDWEHRFEPASPLYMQVSRAGVVLHISEHHGDGSPGSHARVEIEGVSEWQLASRIEIAADVQDRILANTPTKLIVEFSFSLPEEDAPAAIVPEAIHLSEPRIEFMAPSP